MNDYGKRGGGDQITDAVLAAQGAFAGPALEAVSQAKVVALEQAVDLCKEIGYRGSRDPSQFIQAAGIVVAIATQFEAFLTSEVANDR